MYLLNHIKKHPNFLRVQCFLKIQLYVILFIALITLLIFDHRQAISALLGGLTALLPMALFARKLFAHQGAKAAKNIVRSFYLGEMLKIILSVSLFSLIFIMYEVKPVTFFLMYIAVVMQHWFAPLIIDK